MGKIFENEKPALEVSIDEQVHRQSVYQDLVIEPGQKAVDVLEKAIDMVLKTLGVNIEDTDTIQQQMKDLNIIMTEHDDERAPQLNGFFIFRLKKPFDIFEQADINPYAWVGAARLDNEGRVYCDIEWFETDKLSEVGGEKII